MVPPVGATRPSLIALLWTFLLCAHSERTCVNAFTESAQPNRDDRRLQETTLINASQVVGSGGSGVPDIGSPPVDSTIYRNSLAAGWDVKAKGNSGVRQQQVAGAGNGGSQAFCATLPAKGDAVYFNCHNCSQSGFGPFELNKTSGFNLTIRRTDSDYKALDEDSSQAVVPDVHVFLGNDSLLRAEPEGNFKSDHPEPQCNFGLDTYAETLNRQSPDSARFTVYSDALINSTSRNDTTGFFARSFLFQNYQACIESRSDLTRVTSIGFTSQSANVSFCLEDLKLLPSQIPSAEVLASAAHPSYPRSYNCISRQPQPIDEDGYFLVSQSTIAQNVTGTLPSTGYTVFPGVTVPLDTYSMAPVSNTCSTNTSAPYITQVNECASRMETCCLDQFDFNGNQLVAEDLAKICNGLTVDGIVCQGFTYDGKVVMFKGQSPNTYIDIKYDACNSPGQEATFWGLNAALGTGIDERPIAAPPSPPPLPPAPPAPLPPPPTTALSTDSKIGTAWGVAAAVVGPSIALGTWFLLTWNYRSEKKIITDEVMKRLKVSDICAVDSALQYAPAGVSSTGQAKQAKKIGAFHSAELELQALRNPAKRSSLDDVIGSGSFTSAVSASSDAPPQVTSIFRSGGHASYGEPSPETKKTAREITRRCLRRWDGLLGIRASSDSLGNRAGIWRDRFDTVRCAVLLLAFRKLNQALQGDPSSFRADCPGCLLDAWQNSSSHSHRRDVISWVSKRVLEITEDDAQALHAKDPEHPGFYDDMCNRLTCCNGR